MSSLQPWIWKFPPFRMTPRALKPCCVVLKAQRSHLWKAAGWPWALCSSRAPVGAGSEDSVQDVPPYRTSLKLYFSSVALVLDAEILYGV